MSFETDERLKSFLDSNQLAREQLCLALMGSDRRFKGVKPRHPRGGPDGGRDIEATLDGQLIYGAVGFVNQASDSSNEQKSRISKKFVEDAASAWTASPQPEGFAFFTNLNFTVSEKDELAKAARELGFKYSEVFDRERLRILLDSPDGFATRFQFLHIPLSEPEQATFFSKWGADIQTLVSEGFSQLERKLNRLEFLADCNAKLRHLTVRVELDKEYDATELGHIRCFCSLFFEDTIPVNTVALLFGAFDNDSRCQDERPRTFDPGKGGAINGIHGQQWRAPFDESLLSTEESEQLVERKKDSHFHLLRGGWVNRRGYEKVRLFTLHYSAESPFSTTVGLRLADLNGSMFLLQMNASLAERIRSFQVYANEYLLAQYGPGEFKIDKSSFDASVPVEFTEAELKDKWVRIRPPVYSAFDFRFSEVTPARSYHPTDVVREGK
jgi:hypothetical protein